MPALLLLGALSCSRTPPPPVAHATRAAEAAKGDLTSAAGAVQQGSGRDCAAVLDCALAACGDSGEPGCLASCVRDAAPVAAANAAQVFGCYRKTCVLDLCKGLTRTDCADDCIKTRCLAPLLACLEDGTQGSRGCAALAVDMEVCRLGEPAPFACLAARYNALDAAGKERALQVAACTTAAKTRDTMKECLAPVLHCLLGGRSGQQPCRLGLDCIAGCRSGKTQDDLACIAGCVGPLSRGDQDLVAAALPCLGTPTTRSEQDCDQSGAEALRACRQEPAPTRRSP